MNKKNILMVTVSILMTLIISIPSTLVFAEQSGSTPESGVTSRIRQVYDALVGLAYGDESAGSWGDWGTMWNRIRSAAEWTPDGTATSEDVVAGETFYGSSRVRITGTGPQPIDFSLQQFMERDDYAGPYYTGLAPEDYQQEEAEWTDHSVNTDIVWKDERTGVYWSPDRGVLTTNSFTAISLNTCDFFDETQYSTRGAYPGGDSDCGDAINYCATLDFGGRTDWYLPSQKELMMAYIDGMYNQAGATPTDAAAFTYGTTSGGGYPFWSSSEVSDVPTYAWGVYLYRGNTDSLNKADDYAVRCVARD
jgi:hypothetical protein